ncbi:MAG TPA: hypothetical protein VGK19_08730 [Capsulimonadaceae bacterium]|jgi:hypothetical protein
MTVILDLTVEEEAHLMAKSARAGLAPDAYLRILINAPDNSTDPSYSDEWTDEDLRDATSHAIDCLGADEGTDSDA